VDSVRPSSDHKAMSNRRLGSERVRELVKVAVELDLHDRRDALLASIPRTFTSNMKISSGGRPRDQLQLDLETLDEAGPLDDSDPLVIWLRNALDATTGRPGAEAFHRSLDEVQLPLEPGGATWDPPPRRPEDREVVIHREDRVPFQFLEEGRRAGESIALVSVARFEEGEKSIRWHHAKGTGWLIGPRLLITAHHVVNARLDDEPDAADADFEKQALHTQATFAYDREGQPGTKIEVAELAAQNRELDYVILRLAADPGLPPLELAEQAPAVGPNRHPPLNIIQHPHGRPKMLAFRNNLATTVTERPGDLGYFTDTDQGASGAPVFDDDWHVVALHRAAAEIPVQSFQGKDIAWANLGTRIEAIRGDLQQQYPRLWRSIEAAQSKRKTTKLEASGPHLTLIRSPSEAATGSPPVQRLRQSTTALREWIQAIAKNYQENQTSWIWDLHQELARVRQQLEEIRAWLRRSGAEDEILTVELRHLLSHHGRVERRFVGLLGELQSPQAPLVQQARLRHEFEQVGQSLLDHLTRICMELESLRLGPRLPGSD
jgi:V8-like Glu-specific endopeptidase